MSCWKSRPEGACGVRGLVRVSTQALKNCHQGIKGSLVKVQLEELPAPPAATGLAALVALGGWLALEKNI